FAGTQYLHGLAQGDRLSASGRDEIVRKLHAYLGLSESYIRDSNMRISYPRFQKELLRGRNQIVGRLDARFQTYGLDAAADSPEWDPADVAVTGAYVGAFERYVHDQLHYSTNLIYRPTA